MYSFDLTGKNVLISGGTQGIGLGAAESFARAGAKLFLTFRWGSADNEKISHYFNEQGWSAPTFIQADVAKNEDTQLLMETIAKEADGIDIYICNVCVAPQIKELSDYTKRAFYKTLDYSSWPFIDYYQQLFKYFKRYPRYLIGISSSGPDSVYPAYDFVALAKSVLEVMARYLAIRMGKDSIINVVRFGPVMTDSFQHIFGKEWQKKIENDKLDCPELTPEKCGESLVALCSGLLDALRGQVLSIDYGWVLQDNLLNHLQHDD